jgi:hypothetical protein
MDYTPEFVKSAVAKFDNEYANFMRYQNVAAKYGRGNEFMRIKAFADGVRSKAMAAMRALGQAQNYVTNLFGYDGENKGLGALPIAAAAVVAAFLLAATYFYNDKQKFVESLKSLDSCLARGYPPEQCGQGINDSGGVTNPISGAVAESVKSIALTIGIVGVGWMVLQYVKGRKNG